MRIYDKIPKGALLFAPMEGITDECYRMAIHKAFPEWDLYATDFLRVTSQGLYNNKKIIKHFGEKIYKDEEQRKKTTFQILTAPNAHTKETVSQIQELGFDHLDLNLGCPSKRVNSHKGGAYLLSDFKELKPIIKDIRETFKGIFTVKIRVGYRDDSAFEDCLRLFEDEGVEGITIHGRTRDQLYKGKANWEYIKRAVEVSNLPIIGNGDIWTLKDIKEMFEFTGCHGVMLARGALKTPWMATLYREYKDEIDFIDDDELIYKRKEYLDLYFHLLIREYKNQFDNEKGMLRRFKSFSHYLFDDLPRGVEIQSKVLRSESMNEFLGHLESL